MDWSGVIYNFFHSDSHLTPEQVGELTLEQYIVLSRSNKESKGRVAIKNKEELKKLKEHWEKKQTTDEQMQAAERMYRVSTGEYICELI